MWVVFMWAKIPSPVLCATGRGCLPWISVRTCYASLGEVPRGLLRNWILAVLVVNVMSVVIDVARYS
jgi:hypothetical protein